MLIKNDDVLKVLGKKIKLLFAKLQVIGRISVKKFRMKILKIIIDTINRYSKLRDFSLSFVLS